ncbi:hypothetical protein [Enhygromyxa salina]|uniref:hypothetical protein n=1 Tax=Enhygromyxa salina TaxID=215803 RepID=UPI000D094DAB|nr:hypothetical protein [Enhygromyxa salina]
MVTYQALTRAEQVAIDRRLERWHLDAPAVARRPRASPAVTIAQSSSSGSAISAARWSWPTAPGSNPHSQTGD